MSFKGVFENAGTIQLLTKRPAVVALYALKPVYSLIHEEASNTTEPEKLGVVDPILPTAPILNTVLIGFMFCARRPLQHSSTTTKLITRSVNRCDWCTIVVV
jgi:hypothetical protein